MTFEELVNETCERLNLSSDEAKSRVGRELNARYRRVTSTIGLETSRRTQVSATANIGTQDLTFTGIEKVIAVIDKSTNVDILLTQVTPDEIHILPLKQQPPRNFAVNRMHTNSVDIKVDCVATTGYTLYADGHANLSTLAGAQRPDFPESFHDVLIFGAMSDEYRKMEKPVLYQACETDYEKRLSDLRMWIAKTAYLDQQAGKYNTSSMRWNRNGRILWDQ